DVLQVAVDRGGRGAQADRRAGDRVDAGEGEVLAGVQRGAGAAHGHARGQRQRVAAGVTVDLERGVAVDVPAEAQARAELVLDLDVGLAFAVEVLEGVPARAEVG